MKKRYLYLFVLLCIFAPGKAQNHFDFGFRVNQAAMQKLTSGTDNQLFFATDYTAFIQYKAVGFFGGVTALNNYSTVLITDRQHIECLSAGLFFKLAQLSKKGSLCFYLYDVHFFSALYGQTIDVITFNPRYRYNLVKNFLTAEAGLSIGINRDYFTYGGPTSISYVRPTIGANISVGLNIVALFKGN